MIKFRDVSRKHKKSVRPNIMFKPFKPPLYIRNKHVQTILSSKQSAFIGSMVQQQKLVEIKVNIPETVRLHGYYSKQNVEPSKGLVVLLHGWLGSVDSSYMLARGERLFQAGFSVFRLNMRDHGETAHLNTGLFHGALIDEVYQAIQKIAQLDPESPLSVIGFSMGGSFALRVGWKNGLSPTPIDQLKQVIAICPSVNPADVTKAIDKSPIYRRYFAKRWQKVLEQKQRLFSSEYDLSNILSKRNCYDITRALIQNYSEFDDIEDYFEAYQLSPQKAKQISVPSLIISAKDDPVIPVEAFSELDGINPYLQIYITQYGGHVGYIHDLRGASWLDTALLNYLTQHL